MMMMMMMMMMGSVSGDCEDGGWRSEENDVEDDIRVDDGNDNDDG